MTPGQQGSLLGTEIEALNAKLELMCSVAKKYSLKTVSVYGMAIELHPEPPQITNEGFKDGGLPAPQGMPTDDEMLHWSVGGLADEMQEAK